MAISKFSEVALNAVLTAGKFKKRPTKQKMKEKRKTVMAHGNIGNKKAKCSS